MDEPTLSKTIRLRPHVNRKTWVTITYYAKRNPRAAITHNFLIRVLPSSRAEATESWFCPGSIEQLELAFRRCKKTLLTTSDENHRVALFCKGLGVPKRLTKKPPPPRLRAKSGDSPLDARRILLDQHRRTILKALPADVRLSSAAAKSLLEGAVTAIGTHSALRPTGTPLRRPHRQSKQQRVTRGPGHRPSDAHWHSLLSDLYDVFIAAREDDLRNRFRGPRLRGKRDLMLAGVLQKRGFEAFASAIFRAVGIDSSVTDHDRAVLAKHRMEFDVPASTVTKGKMKIRRDKQP